MLFVLALAATAMPPAAADGATDAAGAFLLLKGRALAGEGGEDPLAALEPLLAAAGEADAAAVRAAWRDALAAPPPARAEVLRAEAALLALAAAEARAAPNATEAAPWLRLVLARVPWEARDVPAGLVLDDAANATAEAVRDALDAALAQRAREEVVAALLLREAGLAQESRAHAEGAAALLALVVPEASARLPDGLRAALEGNASRVPDLVAAADDRTGHGLAALLGPLAALEYGRDVERLDELALRNADGAFAAARAAAEDPAVAEALREQARLQYVADRAALFLAGEGGVEAVDDAYRALRDASGAGEVAAAASQVHAALRPLGLLERGVVVKVETGGVQPGRTHVYAVYLVRPPLEGVASFNLSLHYDPDVVRVTEVRPRAPLDAFRAELAAGNATFAGEGLLRRSVHLASFAVEATGPANATTEINVARAVFVEPDGDAAAVFRLRDGAATVAYLEVEADEAPADAPREAPPAGLAAALALLALGAAVRRRRA